MPASLVTSRANPRVKQLRGAFAGQARLSGGLIAIEGEHLLYEATRSGMVLKTIFLSERAELPEWAPRSVEMIELTEEVFASVVDTQAPQGIAALVVPPVWTLDDALDAKGPGGEASLLLMAVGLQDPGNLGTLIRSGEAFGVTAILNTPGTVSGWNQKTLRASAGSVFRMPVVAVGADDVPAMKSRGLRLFAAVADSEGAGAESSFLADADLTQPCALMIGNEGKGLSEEWLALADARITIPMPGRVESLNAAIAGSLLMYEASRQRQPGSKIESRTYRL